VLFSDMIDPFAMRGICRWGIHDGFGLGLLDACELAAGSLEEIKTAKLGIRTARNRLQEVTSDILAEILLGAKTDNPWVPRPVNGGGHEFLMPGLLLMRCKAIHSRSHAVSGANHHTGFGFRLSQHSAPTIYQQVPLFKGRVTDRMLAGWRNSRTGPFSDVCVLALGLDMRPSLEEGWRGCRFEDVVIAYRQPVNDIVWSFSAREVLARDVSEVTGDLDLDEPVRARVLEQAEQLRRKYTA